MSPAPLHRTTWPCHFSGKVVLALLVVLIGCHRHHDLSTPVTFDGSAMGSNWSIKLDHLPPNQSAEALRAAVAALLESLDQQMSNYRPTSDLSRFNQTQSTDWQPVPPDLAGVITLAQEVSDQSGGAFDITVAPLVDLWGFGPEPRGVRAGQIPTDAEIADARSHVGYAKLEVRLDPPALKKSDPLLTIDLGAIGKGYAADRVAEMLVARGCTDYLVTIGGELRVHGRPYHVGIETPTPDTRRIFQTLDLAAGQSLSTSGDYRNFTDLNNHRYCHEIDPHTGRPIDGNLASVSVLNESGTRADAWATALIVLGPTEGPRLAQRLHLSALFISRSAAHFDTQSTSGFPADTTPSRVQKP